MNITGLLDRQLQTSGIGPTFGQMQEYGCWCYLGSEHGKGRGSPQDEFDNNCQSLHHGLTCVEMDIPTCQPASGKKYNVVVNVDSNGDQSIDCETLNVGDDCAEAVCYLESYFATNFLELVLTQFITPNMPKYKVAAGFDNSVCMQGTPPRQGDFTEFCCGEYPANTRKPIKVHGGEDRECCTKENGRFNVFNPNLNECCDGGQVEAVGAC